MEARLDALYKRDNEYEVLGKFKGETLFGKGYQPLFSYFAHVSFCLTAHYFVISASVFYVCFALFEL